MHGAMDIGGMRLLVAEDEYLLARHLTEIVEDLGACVLGPVPSCEEGFGLIQRCGRIDAAILDITLRGETVYPLADALLARDVPVVFTSGYSREFIPDRYDGVPLLMKPIPVPAMVATLADLCGRSRNPVH